MSSYYMNQSVHLLTSTVTHQPGEPRAHRAYDMRLLDSLLTVSPITDVVPVPETQRDMICLSGYHQRSSLTFVKEHIPTESMRLRDIQGVTQVHSVRRDGLEFYVFVGTTDSTIVLVPLKPGQFEEVVAGERH
jgi:hypothetical protein